MLIPHILFYIPSQVLVQELADGGDLFDYINHWGFGRNEVAIKHIFGQLVAGLSYIHSQGISHRDIKPENIVLTSDHQAKIIDFGLSEQSRYVCFSLSNLKTY